MNTISKIPGVLLIVGSFLPAASGLAQGTLTPPGAPAPTMKTLTQIEPRTPIESLPFTISQSGSYYFTKNLNFTGTSGDAITVSASDVTIDLRGFTLSSAAGVTGNGINILSGALRCTVGNGGILGTTTVGSSPWTVTPGGFTTGVAFAGNARGARLLDLTTSKCRSNGLGAGLTESLAERCFAFENGNTGITAAVVAGCVASNNGNNGIYAASVTNCRCVTNGNFGIAADTVSGSIANGNGLVGIGANSVSHSRANLNAGNGIGGEVVVDSTSTANEGEGIYAETVTNCVSNSNMREGIDAKTVRGSTASQNGEDGIVGDTISDCTSEGNERRGITGNTVADCTATGNSSHGIYVTGTARNNQCNGNGPGGNAGAGIYFDQDGVRIEGNNCIGNDWGIRSAAGVSGFIVRNSCRSNAQPPTNAAPATSSYDFDRATNTYGPVITVNGDMSANAATSHPGANIQY